MHSPDQEQGAAGTREGYGTSQETDDQTLGIIIVVTSPA
jgi:hypothetical protein